MLDPNALIYIPYARVNCVKTIPFTAAHTYIAHIWQYPPKGGPRRTADPLIQAVCIHIKPQRSHKHFRDISFRTLIGTFSLKPETFCKLTVFTIP